MMHRLAWVVLVCWTGVAWAQDDGDGEAPVEGGAPGAVEGGAPGEGGAAAAAYTVIPPQFDVKDGPPIEFDGETLEDVVDQIKARDTVGELECATQLFLDDATEDNAPVTRCKVVAQCVRTLPTWTNRNKRPAAAQKEWDRFRDAVRKHEDGHTAVSKPHFDGVCKAARGKTHAQAEALFEEAKKKAREANDAHDTKTDHGKKTGSMLDGTKDPKTSNTAGYQGGDGEVQAEAQPEPQPEAQPEPQPEAQPEPQPEE